MSAAIMSSLELVDGVVLSQQVAQASLLANHLLKNAPAGAPRVEWIRQWVEQQRQLFRDTRELLEDVQAIQDDPRVIPGEGLG